MADIYDIVIIGAGPAGLSCAIEAGRAGLRSIVLDKGNVAESIQRFQREMFFFSTPELLSLGDLPFIVPTVRPTSADCVTYYRHVVRHFGIACGLYKEVRTVERQGNELVVRTTGPEVYRARAVVVATGYYDTPSPLGVRGEDLPHVSHYYRDPFPYFDRDVVIVGGKNSAVEAALDLWRHGARVTVVHRGAKPSSGVKYWILPDFENRVAQGAIRFIGNSVVRSIDARNVVVGGTDAAPVPVKADAVFILIGYRPDVRFLQSLGVTVDPDTIAPSFREETMETNIPGIYVAGGLVGGRFNNKVFIENGRMHAMKIVPAIAAGRRA